MIDLRPALLALLLVAGGASSTSAQGAAGFAVPTDRTHGEPDWPCVQRKVATLSPAAIWQGAAGGDSGRDWRSDPEIAALVGELSRRRLPIEEGVSLIGAFFARPENRSADAAARLFAGLFETVSAERSRVIDGIERYARRQRDLATAIRAEQAGLDALRKEGVGASGDATAERAASLEGITRVFDERRRSLTFVCEVPVLLEQRLFAFARSIPARFD